MRVDQLKLRLKLNDKVYMGWAYVEEIQDALTAEKDLQAGILVARLKEINPGLVMNWPPDFDVEVDFNNNDDDEVREKINTVLNKVLNPEPRTLLTKENLQK